MPQFIAFLASALPTIFEKIFDVTKDVSKTFFLFITINGKLLIKWAIFLIIINLTFTLFSFLIYTIYYGGAFVLSHFVTMTTLNIMHMGFLSSVLYFIYKFLYKN